MCKRLVQVSDCGRRVGQDHHNAKLTDREVELIRIMRERDGMPYHVLSEKFDAPKTTIAMICQYKRRVDIATRWKEVEA